MPEGPLVEIISTTNEKTPNHPLVELINPSATPLVELISQEDREHEGGKEILVRDNVLEELKKMTRESRVEFLVYLLGRGDVSEVIAFISKGHEHGISLPSDYVIDKLRFYTNQGYQVKAEYHNHPPRAMEEFKAAGLSQESAIGPSISDLKTDPYSIQSILCQKQFPRIIGMYSPSDDTVHMNAFQVVRNPNPQERKYVTFSNPIFTPEKDEASIVQITNEILTDPAKLGELGLIQLVPFRSVDANGNKKDIPNPLLSIVTSKHSN